MFKTAADFDFTGPEVLDCPFAFSGLARQEMSRTCRRLFSRLGDGQLAPGKNGLT